MIINFNNPEIWVAIAFLAFAILFGRFIWRAITKILDAQINTIKKEIDEANSLHMEAKDLLADYTKKFNELEKSLENEMKNNELVAKKLINKNKLRIQDAIDRLKKITSNKIKLAEANAVNSLKKEIANSALSLSSEILRNNTSKNDKKNLLDLSVLEITNYLDKQKII